MSTLVREFVDGRIEEVSAPGPDATIAQVARAYAKIAGVRLEDLAGPSKAATISHHRHRLMYLTRQIVPAASYALIGRYLGGRDMATIHEAVAKITSAVEKSLQLATELSEVEDALRKMIAEATVGILPSKPWQLPAALAVLRDVQMTDAEARKVALSFLEQLEAGHA